MIPRRPALEALLGLAAALGLKHPVAFRPLRLRQRPILDGVTDVPVLGVGESPAGPLLRPPHEFAQDPVDWLAVLHALSRDCLSPEGAYNAREGLRSMARTESTLNPTVERVLAEAAEGPPKPLLECSAEEAAEVRGAEPNNEMDVTDVDGWDGGEEG